MDSIYGKLLSNKAVKQNKPLRFGNCTKNFVHFVERNKFKDF